MSHYYYSTNQSGLVERYRQTRMTPTGRVVLDNGHQYKIHTDGHLAAIQGAIKPRSLVPETPELKAKYMLQKNYMSSFVRLREVMEQINWSPSHATQEKIDIINRCIAELETVK